MDTPQSASIKAVFYNVVFMHDLDYPTLQVIAEMAEVENTVIDAMFTSVAIRRIDAEKVLKAFSKYVGKPYTFENVKVALKPTLSEIVDTHNLSLATLYTHSGVSITVIDMMLCDEPVPVKEAHLVLQMASRLTGLNCTLDTVDLPTDEEVNNG